jgi:hypothetical protein
MCDRDGITSLHMSVRKKVGDSVINISEGKGVFYYVTS